MSSSGLRDPVALSIRGLHKNYGVTRALSDITVDLRVGEIAALTGENGAGKSTLIRIATGIEHADRGEMYRDGAPLHLPNRHHATREGIFCVYQDQPFVSRFPVFRQMYLGYERWFRRRGVLSDRLMRKACSDQLSELGLDWLKPNDEMGRLSQGARELVALATVVATARLLEIQHPVIFLDEPTSALSASDVQVLSDVMHSLKPTSAIAFVSHRVSEVLEWSDVIWVLRDGRNADMMRRDEGSPERIHIAMAGQAESDLESPSEGLAASTPGTVATGSGPAQTGAPAAYEILDVRLTPTARRFSFRVQPGEIVGLAGVEGSGKEEFLKLCYGLLPAESGPLEVAGRARHRNTRQLHRAGVAYLSGERQRDGVLPGLSIAENMALSERCAAGSRGILVDRRRERRQAEELVDRLAVKTAGVEAPLRSLSGGNQQKVLLGRCLAVNPSVLLLDNVTRGVDIVAKVGIHDQLRQLAHNGVGLVLASDDLEELVAIADRVVVFRRNEVAREFVPGDGAGLNEMEVLAAMV